MASRAAVGGAALSVALAGCGDDDFENEPRPAVPIELTGVIQDEKVTVSPDKEGAGPVADHDLEPDRRGAHRHARGRLGARSASARSSPQDTATIQKTLAEGNYEVRAGSDQATEEEIAPAELDDRARAREQLGRAAAAVAAPRLACPLPRPAGPVLRYARPGPPHRRIPDPCHPRHPREGRGLRLLL